MSDFIGFEPELNWNNKNADQQIGVGFLAYDETEKRIFFIANNGREYEKDHIHIAGQRINTDDYFSHYPRPRIINNTTIKTHGDVCLYATPDSDSIIIINSINAITALHRETPDKDNTSDDFEKSVTVRSTKDYYQKITTEANGSIYEFFKNLNNEEIEHAQRLYNIKKTLQIMGDVVLQVATEEEDEVKPAIDIRLSKDPATLAIKDKNKNTITISAAGITIEDKNKNVITCDASGIKIVTPQDLTLTSPNVKITGGELTVKGMAAPGSGGPFCGIQKCLFTGAPHVGQKVTGT